MRRVLFLVGMPLAFAVACASSEDEPETPAPGPGGPTTLTDAGAVDAAPSPDAGADAIAQDTCSPEGWCITALPDVDLVFKDIWPLPNGTLAFAIAESPTLGVKVLAWDKASDAWSYIDDNTQNDPGYGKYAGGIWASGDADVYFTVAPGTVYHGTRPAPSAPWSWVRSSLPDNSLDDPRAPGAFPHDHGDPFYPVLEENYPALGVWGTSSTDVYAWYANTVFHWSRDDAGAPGWVPEYVADDVESDPDNPNVVEHIYFTSAAGSSADDVWFSGARDRYPDGTSCPLLVQKTAKGYARIADGIVPGAGGKSPSCEERRGVMMIGGSDAWLTDLQTLTPDRIYALKGRDVVKLSPGKGGYAVALSEIGQPVTIFKSGLSSLWATSDGTNDEVWLSGFGLVIRGEGAELWGKDTSKAYRISSIALNGAPTRRPIHRIRGTSPNDLWAVGARYAFHKTTP